MLTWGQVTPCPQVTSPSAREQRAAESAVLMGSQGTKGPLGRINTKAAPGTLVQLRAALLSCLMRDLLIGIQSTGLSSRPGMLKQFQGKKDARKPISNSAG